MEKTSHKKILLEYHKMTLNLTTTKDFYYLIITCQTVTQTLDVKLTQDQKNILHQSKHVTPDNTPIISSITPKPAAPQDHSRPSCQIYFPRDFFSRVKKTGCMTHHEGGKTAFSMNNFLSFSLFSIIFT
jgi:hypothetical protein